MSFARPAQGLVSRTPARISAFQFPEGPLVVVQGENDAIVRVTVAGQPYAIDDRRN